MRNIILFTQIPVMILFIWSAELQIKWASVDNSETFSLNEICTLHTLGPVYVIIPLSQVNVERL